MKLILFLCLALLSCASPEKSVTFYPHPKGDGIVYEYKNHPLPKKCVELNAAGCYTVEFTDKGTKWGIYWWGWLSYPMRHERAHVNDYMIHTPWVNKCMTVTQSGGVYIKGDRWCIIGENEVLINRK